MAHRILILFAHPAYQRSRANQHLVEAVRDMANVTFHEVYPDFLIDVAREKQLLVDHDGIVFQHPFYWYSCPALMKEWLDLVLEYGFAYGEGGTALRGKWLLSALTTGGSRDAYRHGGYNHFTMRELLRPFEQTAVLCGMRYLPPFVAHSMSESLRPGALQEYANHYGKLMERLRDEDVASMDLDNVNYINELVEEPSSNA